jgi:signal transduction histidine kinase
VVEIGDNGPGIPAEVRRTSSNRSFTTKGVGEGTGLGLDTVQRIVKKHRGNMILIATRWCVLVTRLVQFTP